MYRMTVVVNGEFYEGEDVMLDFETYDEVCKYAKKFIESSYIVEIMYLDFKED